jgi:hypothetical protein
MKNSHPTSIRLTDEDQRKLAEIQEITGEATAPLIMRLARLQAREELKRLKPPDANPTHKS